MNAVIQQLHAWSKDALYNKAQRYAQQMLELPRDEWQFVLWSTFVLELLARASLSHVSPALLADTKDRSNILFSIGIPPKAAKFIPKSVDITEAFARLAQVCPEFTPEIEGICLQHMARRNEELHSGDTPLDGLGVDTWLPGFYRACDVLTRHMGESLESLVGQKESAVGHQIIAAALDQSAKAIQKTVAAHKTVWDGKQQAERDQLVAQASVWASRKEGHRVSCPSCHSDALVDGSPIAAPLKRFVDDIVTETQEYLPTKFECVACGLKISGLPQLHACGLGSSYKATLEYDAVDYFAVKDPMHGYEPDYNEP